MVGFFVLIFLLTLILLPVGLIKPSLFQKLSITTRKRAVGIFGGILIASFILIGITAPKVTPSVKSETGHGSKEISPKVSPSIQNISPSVKEVTKAPTPTPTPSPTKKPTPTPTKKITPTPTRVITTIPTAAPTVVTIAPTNPPTEAPTAPYVCNCSKTCTQITTCAEAQYQLNTCGCSVRDADHDGVACDSAPLHCQN